jgi:hypothetical protein
MNWDRVRIEKRMSAAAAAGDPPTWTPDDPYPQRNLLRPAAASARKAGRSHTLPRAQQTKPRIARLKSEITAMRSRGNRKETETLARKGLTLLTNAGSDNLRADREFFRDALDWADRRTPTKEVPEGRRPAVSRPTQPKTKSATKKSTRAKQRAASKDISQQQAVRQTNTRPKSPESATREQATRKPVTTAATGSRTHKGDRRQQRFRRRLRFLGELRTAVAVAGGAVIVSKGGLVEVKGPTGTVKFTTGVLNYSARARYETRTRIERVTGLELDSLNWLGLTVV